MMAKIRTILIPCLLLTLALVWVTFGSNILNDGYGLPRDKQVVSPEIESTVPAYSSINDLHGYMTYLAFGFSHCTDNCPHTLNQFIKLDHVLPDDIRLIFVSIDNQRDDLEHLAEFLAQINPNIIGWKIPNNELQHFAQQFNTHLSVGSPSQLEHGSAIQLLNKQGRWVKTYPYLNLNENALLADYHSIQQSSEHANTQNM